MNGQLEEDPNAEWSEGYEAGHRSGYRTGEYERVALATANSDLRSEVRHLRSQILHAQQLLNTRMFDVDHRIYLALQALEGKT